MTTLKETTPIARKGHQCMFCHGTIERGQRYLRQTNIVDGVIGDWICHQECDSVANDLGMFDDCDPDYGLDDESFCASIDQYTYDQHFDNEADDIQADWQGLTRYQEVCKILDELKNNENRIDD